jgi:hypothetical protein
MQLDTVSINKDDVIVVGNTTYKYMVFINQNGIE